MDCTVFVEVNGLPSTIILIVPAVKVVVGSKSVILYSVVKLSVYNA